MYYGLQCRLSPSLVCRPASVEMSHDDGRLIASRAESAQAPWPMTSSFRGSFFRLCFVSTVRPHGVCMCKAPQKHLHISICRLKRSTHPSPLAFLLIKNDIFYTYAMVFVQCVQCDFMLSSCMCLTFILH